MTALLNSSLLNLIHKFLYLDIEKELFQKILIENCKQFPIKVISLKEQNSFCDLVDKIITQKQKGEDSKANEALIDKMVYELYHITEDEQKLIEGK